VEVKLPDIFLFKQLTQSAITLLPLFLNILKKVSSKIKGNFSQSSLSEAILADCILRNMTSQELLIFIIQSHF